MSDPNIPNNIFRSDLYQCKGYQRKTSSSRTDKPGKDINSSFWSNKIPEAMAQPFKELHAFTEVSDQTNTTILNKMASSCGLTMSNLPQTCLQAVNYLWLCSCKLILSHCQNFPQYQCQHQQQHLLVLFWPVVPLAMFWKLDKKSQLDRSSQIWEVHVGWEMFFIQN